MLPNGTALHCAIEFGHLKLAQLLLENGASHILVDEDGGTSLHKVTWVRDLEMFELLSLDVMVGESILERACEEGCEQEALRQLERGIGLAMRDNRDRTAFGVLGDCVVDVMRSRMEIDVAKQGSDRPTDASQYQNLSQMMRKRLRERCRFLFGS